MTDPHAETQDPTFRIVLTAHRSLPPAGFAILLGLVALVSFATGIVFMMIGAWPVFAFFGLDVLIIYIAFRMNYRSGRIHELIEITPDEMTLVRVAPSGRREVFTFNPYWTHVALDEKHDGRTTMSFRSRGRAFVFGRFLNDDERRDLMPVLRDALVSVRAA